jgi:hypothetical protein
VSPFNLTLILCVLRKIQIFYGHQHEFITLKDLEQAMEEYIEYYGKAGPLL